MRNKKWDKCKVFMCPHPTWSGKIERDITLRVCSYHMPYRFKKYEEFAALKKANANPKKIVIAKSNPLSIPLRCVYKAVQSSAPQGDRRTFFTHGICGAIAVRDKKKRVEPRYKNRFGEPLCE